MRVRHLLFCLVLDSLSACVQTALAVIQQEKEVMLTQQPWLFWHQCNVDILIYPQELNLRGNGFRGLPKQLEDRKFARLRRLDLSNNPLGGEISISVQLTYQDAAKKME